MDRIGKFTSTIGHLIAAVVVGLRDIGDTPWLRAKLNEEPARLSADLTGSHRHVSQ